MVSLVFEGEEAFRAWPLIDQSEVGLLRQRSCGDRRSIWTSSKCSLASSLRSTPTARRPRQFQKSAVAARDGAGPQGGHPVAARSPEPSAGSAPRARCCLAVACIGLNPCRMLWARAKRKLPGPWFSPRDDALRQTTELLQRSSPQRSLLRLGCHTIVEAPASRPKPLRSSSLNSLFRLPGHPPTQAGALPRD